MAIYKPPSTQPFSVSFRTYSSEEIKKLSVKEITNPQFFTDIGSPYPGGLYDSALGPSEKNDVCSTCLLSPLHCPGHLGHITLPLPVLNPLYIRLTVQLLHGSCLKCHRLAAPQFACQVFLCKLKLINSGRIDLLDKLNEDHLKEVVESGDITSVQYETDEDETTELIEATIGESIDFSEKVDSAPDRCIASFRNELISDFIRDNVRKRGKKCRLCEAPLHTVKLENNVRILTKGFDNGKPATVTISAQDAKEHLKKIYLNDKRIICKLYGMFSNYEKCQGEDWSAVDQLFLEVIPIIPARFRPVSGGSFDAAMNSESFCLGKVIQICIGLRELIHAINKEDKEGVAVSNSSSKSPSLHQKLQRTWYELQTAVNSIVDSDLDKLDKMNRKKGIKQILERKEGIFRKFMMGKRVNYAARSVISPDPNINSDEIGIPEIIAKKLTYPEFVTGRNVQELRQAVKNGPNVHPGAVAIEMTPGKVVRLNAFNQTSRDAMANRLLAPGNVGDEFSSQKKVLRHIRTGDVVLLNRQPTLHKPSIMAHKVRILPGEKTLRLHYSACKTYNADFDGDEMNVHFPQNEMGRAEATMIANTCDQYLVPKDGTPLGGLIQDHMVAGVHMTIRGRFFTREEYQQLVFAALFYMQDTVELLPPTMIKPAFLWSGKQVISTVLRNIIPKSKKLLNFKGSTKVKLKSWIKSKPRVCRTGGSVDGNDMSEAEVIIRDGELLCGILDKENYGPTPYGMVHCCYELYGGHVGVLLLSCLGRLFTTFLQQISGFSLGVKDIIVLPGANEERQKIIQQAPSLGEKAIAEALELETTEKQEVSLGYGEAHREPGGKRLADVERTIKVATDKLSEDVREVCLPKGLLMKFPENNLQTMILSGAKGSQVNALQISCLLGQIELEGRRPPLMTSGKSLPSFQSYDPSLRAGGYVAGRFLTGIRPQEYFFHCMAGREGLIDTAVKTSRSGYLQRCIIKHLEGLVVNYDLTVRDSDNSVIQFSYGEDGLDISRTPFLKRDYFQFFMDNESVDEYRASGDKSASHLNPERAEKLFKQVRKWKRRNEGRERYRSGFVNFSEGLMQPLVQQIQVYKKNISVASCYNKARYTLVEMWRQCNDKASYEKPFLRCPDPPQCQLNPSQNFGAVSERMNAIIENYLRDFQESPSTPLGNIWEKENFKQMIYHKYRRSLCDPGEAVGLLAAQSIGEPSTQMTLNTFHFAGRGEMNVTLGIPRLREILLVASKDIKTPGMSVPVLQTKKAAKKINKLCKKLSKVFLSDVLEDMEVLESFQISKENHHLRVYKIHLKILPPEYASTGVSLSSSQVLKHIETQFLEKLFTVIKMRLRELQRIRIAGSKTSVLDFLQDTPSTSKNNENADDDTEGDMMIDTQSDGDEEGGTEEDAKIKRGEEDEYDEEDGEEQEETQANDDQTNDDVEEGTKAEPSSGEQDENKKTDQQDAPVEGSINLKRLSSSSKKTISDVEKGNRIQGLVDTFSLLQDYNFDQEEEQWCEFTIGVELMNNGKPDVTSIISELARQSVVYQASGIERCIVAENNGVKLLQTEGVNLKQLYPFENILDLKKLYTNDVHAMAKTYGIEAAAHVLIKEIQGVFAVYGIAVDPRHLSLIADYMTFDGFYKPFNRRGLDSNPSTLQRMSFESSLQVLREATVQGTQDSLQSPSARLVLGRVVAGGTGCFDVLPQVL